MRAFLLSTWLQLFADLRLFDASLKENKMLDIQHLTLGLKRRQLCMLQFSSAKVCAILPNENQSSLFLIKGTPFDPG
jgi:hypothetical protein